MDVKNIIDCSNFWTWMFVEQIPQNKWNETLSLLNKDKFQALLNKFQLRRLFWFLMMVQLNEKIVDTE